MAEEVAAVEASTSSKSSKMSLSNRATIWRPTSPRCPYLPARTRTPDQPEWKAIHHQQPLRPEENSSNNSSSSSSSNSSSSNSSNNNNSSNSNNNSSTPSARAWARAALLSVWPCHRHSTLPSTTVRILSFSRQSNGSWISRRLLLSRWRASIVRKRVQRLGGRVNQGQLVPGMRQDVRSTQHAKDPHADPLGRASVPLQRLPQVLQPGGQPHGPRQDPLGRETLPLSDLRPPLLAELLRHHPHEVRTFKISRPRAPTRFGF